MDPDEYFVDAEADHHRGVAGGGAREMERAAREGKSRLRRLAELAFDMRTDERAWRRGAEGEEAVARTLAKLSDEWAVVHDLTIGSKGANLDHLVIGPAGVFTLNTKKLTGKLTVYDKAILHNGRKTDFLRKSRAEAKRVAAALSTASGATVDVRPVIVLVGGELDIKRRPEDVKVVHKLGLRRWLGKLPTGVLDPAQVLQVERIARTPSTWPTPR